MNWYRLCLTCGVLATSCATYASARIVELWPYERLFKKSELIVIASAVSTKGTSDRYKANPWPLEMVGQNTTFVVKHVIKGKSPGKKIMVLHFRFGGLRKKKGAQDSNADGECQTQIIDGPSFVRFRTETDAIRINGGEITIPGSERSMKIVAKKVIISAPQYMLFLKKRKDGRFEPVSGQFDPDLSVREIYPTPLPFDVGNPKKGPGLGI